MKSKYLIPLGLAAVGIYLILKSKKPQTTPIVNPIPEPAPRPNTDPSITPPKPNNTASTDVWIVNTASSPLNMRPTPSTRLASIGSFPKGTEIKARPSVVSGWHEVLDTSGAFPKVLGYVSSAYLVKKG